MRQVELVRLWWADVNLDRRFADLAKTENDRPRRVPLSGRAMEAFHSLQGVRSQSPTRRPRASSKPHVSVTLDRRADDPIATGDCP